MTTPPDIQLSTLWLHDFTVDNLIEYANASREISSYIRILGNEGFNHLVIPSRGAVPFIRAAESAWRLETQSLSTYQERLQQKIELLDSPFTQQLVLPFSADTHETTQSTAAIRRFWSKVLNAIIKRDGTDPYLGFYKVLTERLAKQDWLNVLPRDLPDEKFIFVDTVVSGRAICEIINAFDELGLNQCHFILIVNGNRNAIESKYRKVIEDLECENRCTLIFVKRLFTEDRGPAVSGVWSTVYPQIMDAVRNKYEWAKDAYGAGTFYHKLSSSQVEPCTGIGSSEYNMPVTIMYASISIGIFIALSSLHEMDSVELTVTSNIACGTINSESVINKRRSEIEVRMRRQLKYHLDRFREEIEKLKPYSPLKKVTTRLLATPRVRNAHPNATVDISSSHLVRVNFKNKEVVNFMQEVDRELMHGKDVLDDDWFRDL